MNVGKPEASATIWRWKERDAEERTRVAKLQRGGVLRGLVAIAFGALLTWLGRPIASTLAVSLGTLTLFLALGSPTRGYPVLARVVDRVSSFVGTVFAWALLAPAFYLFFTPFGLLARRGTRDKLHRRFEPEARSYWVRRAPDKPGALERPY